MAALAFLALSFGWVMVVNLFGVALAGLFVMLDGQEFSVDGLMERMMSASWLGIGSIIQGLGLLGCALVLVKLRGKATRLSLGMVPVGLAAVGAAVFVGGSIGFFSGWVAQELVVRFPSLDTGHFDLIRSILLEGPVLPRVPMYLAVVVMAPIAEELVFRGALWDFLEESLGRWGALFSTTVLFALYHGDRLHILGILATGLFLGALRLFSGSVWPGIVAHALNNLLGVAVIFVLPEEAALSGAQAVGALSLALVGLLICSFFGRPGRPGPDAGLEAGADPEDQGAR